jgi:hypothetical protein
VNTWANEPLLAVEWYVVVWKMSDSRKAFKVSLQMIARHVTFRHSHIASTAPLPEYGRESFRRSDRKQTRAIPVAVGPHYTHKRQCWLPEQHRFYDVRRIQAGRQSRGTIDGFIEEASDQSEVMKWL